MKKIKKNTVIQISNLRQTFRAINAFGIAIAGGLILTAISMLAHTNTDWTLETNFHLAYSFAFNTLLLFTILVINFRIIKSNLKMKWKYFIAITSSIVVTICISVFAGWLHRLIYDNIRLSDPDSLNLIRDILVAFFALLISILLYSLTRRQQMNIEKEQL